MRLYHYTSIETLALILTHKQILFNRLDNGVDDIEETKLSSKNLYISNKFFVSCWTKNPKESLALWKLYTNNGIGVRIGLEHNMFDNTSTSSNLFTVSLPKIYDDKKCGFLHKHKEGYNLHLYPVNYVSDVNNYITNGIQSNERTKVLNLEILGATKNEIWKFQDEMRFVLYGMPFSNSDSHIKGCKVVDTTNEMVDLKGESLKSILVALTPEAFKNISITLGPCCTEAHRLLVEAIVEKADLSLNIINVSSLSGKIGFKQ